MKFTLFRTLTQPSRIGANELTETAVLFVHGLGGSYGTWNKFSVHLKNNWTEVESFGLEYDEYYGSQGLNKVIIVKFFVKLWRIIVGPDIEQLSKHFRTVIDEVCEEYENIILVAHSMGGLVARKHIVNSFKKTKSAGKIKALITYATPHKGSILANHYLIICIFLRLFFIKDSKQITQLSKGSGFIDDLNKDWSNLRIDDKIDFLRVVGGEDWVVDNDSAALLDHVNVKHIASKGHFNIIKPNRAKDPAFMVTYNYLKKFDAMQDAKAEIEADDDLDNLD